MDNELKIKLLGPVMIGVGGSAVLAGTFEAEFARYLFFAVAVGFLLLGVWLLFSVVRSQTDAQGISGILLLCKNRFKSLAWFCFRCLGFYLGFAASVMIALAHNDVGLLKEIAESNPWLLLGLCLALSTPTVINGVRRRLEVPNTISHPALLFLSGFLCGIAIFFGYAAMNSILLGK